MGCDGGWMDYAFEYVGVKGITTEDLYPYRGVEGACRNPTTVYMKNINYIDVTINSVSSLKAAVTKQPVSVAIEADQAIFQSYKSGVITSSTCGRNLDHGVLVVGYYDTT